MRAQPPSAAMAHPPGQPMAPRSASAPAPATRVRKRPAAARNRDVNRVVGAYLPMARGEHRAAALVAPDRDVGEYSPMARGEHPAAAPNAPDRDVGEYSPTVARVTRRRVGRRPASAAPARYEDLGFQSFPQIEVEEPEWVGMPPNGENSPSLPWADHVVHTLVSNGHLPSHSQKQVQLQAWSDCSGINSEKLAWNELQDAMRRIIGAVVSLDLYYTCDSDAKSIVFAKANHHPRHVGTNMTQRNFTSGLFWCMLEDENLPIPQAGVDVYVGTYPCSPWSRRGARTGWDHPSVEPFRIGLQTICYIQPALFIIELGELPENASCDEILDHIGVVLEQNGRNYIIQLVRSLGPQTQGYPIRRSRTFFLGWRQDVSPDPTEISQPLHTLILNPVDVPSTYRGFLKISHPYDWSGVGSFYGESALQYMSGNACRCACNPYVLCPVHACQCGRCGDDSLQCSWRSLMQHMLEKDDMMAATGNMEGKLTYIQAFEMQGGVGPTQPRGRIFLNIVSMLPQCHPLNDTLMLVDKSQNPPFGSLPDDGLVPTLTTTSQLWCMSAGRELKASELAALMGLDTKKMVLKGQTEAWFRKRLGLTVHVPNFGLVLAAAMAHPLKAFLTMPDGETTRT